MITEQKPLREGNWGDQIKWEFFASESEPPTELTTAVFCVAIDPAGKVVLARSKRGWGLIGGHIEDNESPIEALIRESQEEGGFTPDSPKMFAYKKVISSQPIEHQKPGRQYPYPISYLAYYWAETKSPIIKPYGAEILESDSFTLEQVKSFETLDVPIVELGYESFLKNKK